MNLDNNSKEELQELLAHCVVDIKFTCKLLFPDIFYAPFSTLHQQIFDLINSGVKKIAIAAPRGIGKTSVARTVAMRIILFRLQKFIVYISNSATYATATKVYQEPLALADGTVQIKANLTGLGGGPYYLFVTNNRQEVSSAYNLSGEQPPINGGARLGSGGASFRSGGGSFR